MNRRKFGKIIISFVLVVGAVVSVAVDWNDSHLFNPAWHAHARFHDALMLAFLCGVSALGWWLLWRKSAEPDLGVKIAALIVVLFWLPFFWITWAIPGTSLLAADSASETVSQIGGITVHANVIIAGVLLILTIIGYSFYRSEPDEQS